MSERARLISTLMDEQGDYLKRTAYVMTGDIQIAEDVVQETFISFYKNAHRFREEASYKTYLYKIMVNQVRMHYRKGEGKSFEPLNHDYHGEVVFEDRVIRSMDLHKGLSKLKPKYREALVLHYFNELKIDEICKVSNLSKSTVKMRLKRGREQLYQMIKEGGQYEEME